MEEIRRIYQEIKDRVAPRLSSFKDIWGNGSEERIFSELTFCILTPQSKARQAEKAVNKLLSECLLYECDDLRKIADVLNLVRFKNHKAAYLIEARNKCRDKEGFHLREILSRYQTVRQKREWIAENIKGLGYKEASHFLRNVGFGADLAILDRHILRNLKRFDVIGEEITNLNRKKYLEIEDKMTQWSEKIGIPMDYLDFVLWYREAKDIFK